MHCLAVETSTELCSVALSYRGQIRETKCQAEYRHAELVLKMMQALLAEAGLSIAQLDALAFGRGPGSFTGVRVAASVVQASALVFDLPVIPISSLRALAQGVKRQHRHRQVLAALDARRHEIYWGMYQLDDQEELFRSSEEGLHSPEAIDWFSSLDWQASSWVGAGSGWDVYHEILEARFPVSWLSGCYPSAWDVVQLGECDYYQGKYVRAEQALPIYLRNPVT